jgi:hypothetical protein
MFLRMTERKILLTCIFRDRRCDSTLSHHVVGLQSGWLGLSICGWGNGLIFILTDFIITNFGDAWHPYRRGEGDHAS